jgi:hypothetical protein
MKFLLLALLWGGTAALGQSSSTQSQVNPDKLFEMPQKYSEAAPGFNPPAFDKRLASNPLPHVTVLAPPPGPKDPEIDKKMIVRPPWPARGEGQKGRDMSNDQFPNLRFLPLRGVGAGGTAKGGKDCR